MFEAFINWLVAIILILVGVLPLVFEIREPHKTKPGKKVFSRMGKWFIMTVIIALGATLEKANLDMDSSKTVNQNLTRLTVAHVTDSMQQINRDLACKNDAEMSELRNQEALNHLRDSLNKSLIKTATNINKNSDNNASRIMANDSNKRMVPDLEFLTSYDNYYKDYRKVYNDKYTIPTCLFNHGGLPATDINFTFQVIEKLKPQYQVNDKYEISEEKDLLDNNEDKISSSKGLGTSFNISVSDRHQPDTLYIILYLKYKSPFNVKYHNQGLFIYVPEVDLFSLFTHKSNSELDNYLRKIGYVK